MQVTRDGNGDSLDAPIYAAENKAMNKRISIDPAVCHGKPVIAGTRVLVSTLLGALAGGDSVATLLADYPSITAEDVAAALEFASRLSDYETVACL